VRWIFIILLAYAAVLLQTTLVGMVTFNTEALGAIGPDMVAIVAVFLAMHGRQLADVMIAAWLLGMGLDLTVSGGFGSTTVVGPMGIGYALAAAAIYQIREVLFRDWLVTQAVLTLLFCLLAHGLWLVWQSLAAQAVTWGAFGELLLQALLVSIYSALLAPIGHLMLRPLRSVLIAPGQQRSGRRAGG
jgi:cell shape-determining protein MreD